MKLLVVLCLSFLAAATAYKVQYLNQGDIFHFSPYEYPTSQRFHIYCYEGRPKYIVHIWQSVMLQINQNKGDYVQYEGYTPELVNKEYMEHRSAWHFQPFLWRNKNIKLNPFNQSCIGIDSEHPYTVFLNVIRIDYWKILSLVFGIFLFISAERLSRNSVFYYICGVVFGVCASFLILVYFLSKLLPRKPITYGFAAAGWTIGIYMLQLIWDNLRLILQNYQIYIIWYGVASSVISFIVCYRLGPVENERTKNLIKWSLQITGLLAIFFSSHFQEASMGIIIILLIAYNLPETWLNKPKNYWKKKFPPKIKLLTNDEYYEQGVKETAKALGDLRKYCSSPECNQWKTALKLKDVKRFASFIEGNSHLSDEEILEYETSFHQVDFTDDEETMTDDEY